MTLDCNSRSNAERLHPSLKARGKRTVSLFIGTLFVAAVFLSACESRPKPPSLEMVVFSGPTMGTTYTVKVVGDHPFSSEHKAAITAAIQKVLDEIDRQMSTYRDDSELTRFNRHREATPFRVSAELLEVLQLSEKISRETQGAFDVTVTPLVDLWGFGRNKKPEGYIPTPDEIESARAHVGFEKISIDAANQTLIKKDPNVVCDVGAVAPGFASDKVAEALELLGYKDYMVEIGGEVRARGHNPEKNLWRIGIEKPDELGRVVQKVVPLQDAALSTSGDYRNYFEKDGKRYCHEIDPRSGKPIEHALASVSVIAADCASADAYATALMVLGPEEGMAFADSHAIPAYFLVRQPGGAFEERQSEAFLDYMARVFDVSRNNL